MRPSDCPWCGMRVFRDDVNSTIYHQMPECARFKQIVEAVTSDEQEVVLLVVVEDDPGINDAVKRSAIGVN